MDVLFDIIGKIVTSLFIKSGAMRGEQAEKHDFSGKDFARMKKRITFAFAFGQWRDSSAG